MVTPVDPGTGTGTLTRGFAARGCHVTGIDVAAPMPDQAAVLERSPSGLRAVGPQPGLTPILPGGVGI